MNNLRKINVRIHEGNECSKIQTEKNKHNTAKVTITCKFCRKHSFIPRETFL